ncbi:uncharacterized protein LOC125250452 isoform X2 [Megalobrama amblycephala]|uniref:uncharacterized protein LOC125250452 isoform X2 n=1 Tax=Megalobrama amblycephala TaxID=75352 RepID=UPI0020144063|nr:uncharacterized protein LOC125250452 isoform X2 [Megalobrama amblycephala]
MRGSLLLLSALLLLESTVEMKEYQLGQPETNKIIDKAIKAANERHGKTKHLDFDSILSSPQVSCVECRGEMTCFLLREQGKIKQTVSNCLNPPKRSHITGGETLLSKTAENYQQTGCLGCI